MSNLEEIYIELSNNINRGNIDKIKKILQSSDQIDITQDECDFLYIPIEEDKTEIMNLLMNYFFEIQLTQHQNNSVMHTYLVQKMNGYVLDWLKEYGQSVVMKEMLLKYDINLTEKESNLSSNNIEEQFGKDDEDPIDKIDPLDKTHFPFYFVSNVLNQDYPNYTTAEKIDLKDFTGSITQTNTPEKSIEPMGESNTPPSDFDLSN